MRSAAACPARGYEVDRPLKVADAKHRVESLMKSPWLRGFEDRSWWRERTARRRGRPISAVPMLRPRWMMRPFRAHQRHRVGRQAHEVDLQLGGRKVVPPAASSAHGAADAGVEHRRDPAALHCAERVVPGARAGRPGRSRRRARCGSAAFRRSADPGATGPRRRRSPGRNRPDKPPPARPPPRPGAESAAHRVLSSLALQRCFG